MGYDTGIADRIRAKGVTVVEIDGWRTRGSSTFNPGGAVDHHTAGPGPQHGPIPSLGVLINGRAGLAGPLCNVGMGRDLVAYVIAAGRANHAGSGGWRGLSGNSSVYGLERENMGTAAEPWTPQQHDTAARILAAMIEGRADWQRTCQHKEWTSRKIDCHDVDGDYMRHLVAGYLGQSLPTPTPEDDSMSAQDVQDLKDTLGPWMQEQAKAVIDALKKEIEDLHLEVYKAERISMGPWIDMVRNGHVDKGMFPKEFREKAKALHEKYPAEGWDLLTLGNPNQPGG